MDNLLKETTQSELIHWLSDLLLVRTNTKRDPGLQFGH